MTVSLKHTFVSAKADSADASLVQPSSWNAEHTLTLGANVLLGAVTAGAAQEIGLGAGLSFSGGDLVVSGFASSSHTHVIADVTGLQTALDGKQPLATVLTNTTAAFTTAQETKLSGIATGATANSSDATLLDRANHTGSQAISTVTGLQTALDGKQASGSYQPLATVLTNTTASFTTAQETKLAGIADAAQPDQWTYVKLGADATNSTTTIAATDLAFLPDVNSFYEIEMCMFVQAVAATTGVRLGILWPTVGVSKNAAWMQSPNSATAYVYRIWGGVGNQNVAATGVGGADTNYMAEGKALLVTSGTVTGNFAVTLASEIAASAVTITADSFLKYRKVP